MSVIRYGALITDTTSHHHVKSTISIEKFHCARTR